MAPKMNEDKIKSLVEALTENLHKEIADLKSNRQKDSDAVAAVLARCNELMEENRALRERCEIAEKRVAELTKELESKKPRGKRTAQKETPQPVGPSGPTYAQAITEAAKTAVPTDPTSDQTIPEPPKQVGPSGPTYALTARIPPATAKVFLSRTETLKEKLAAAKTQEEYAKLVMRRSQSNPEARPKTSSLTAIGVNINFLNKNVQHAQPLRAIRAVLQGAWKCPRIEEISLIGRGLSKAEIFVDSIHAEETKRILKEKQCLDERFDPMAPPPFRPDQDRAIAIRQFVTRRARVMANARYGAMTNAAVAGAPAEIQAEIEACARALKSGQKYTFGKATAATTKASLAEEGEVGAPMEE